MKFFQFFYIIFFLLFSQNLHSEQKSAHWLDQYKSIIQNSEETYWLQKDKKDRTVSVKLSPELTEGKRIASTVCAGCHGVDGVSTGAGNSAIVPNLIAQNKQYLIAKLKDYKSGKLKHEQMSMIVKMITEKDIDNVATWYSSIDVIVADPKLPAKPY